MTTKFDCRRVRPARAGAVLASAVSAVLALAAPTAQAQRDDCLIQPWQQVDIRSPVGGLIKALHVERGSMVARGQLLVELDSGVESVMLASARYRSQMEGEQRTAASKLRFSQLKLRRIDELSQEEYASQHERDEAQADAQVAEASLVEARDNRELAALEARRLAEVVEQRRLRSPLAGVVTDRLQQPGELAQGGDGGKPILRLAQIHPLRVELVLPVARHGAVRPGATAQIEPEPPFAGRHTATVKVIDRVVDAASGTFRVWLELPNPDGRITAGVKCRAQF